MTFAPTLEQDRSQYGVKIDRREFPIGVAGVRLSLQEIARRIREGGRSASMRAFAENVVRQTIPPSQHTTTRQAAAAMLAYVVENVRYRADPPLTEWVQGAAITLCINGAPMCIPVGDCDDLITALGSMMMAFGIPVRIVKQTFGAADQEHVLIEFQDEGGTWIAADPTPRSPSLEIGQRAVASHEDYIDPLDPAAIGMVAGTPEAEFIGVGGVGSGSQVLEVRDMNYVNSAWEEKKYGVTWRHVGGTWIEKQAGLGDTSTGVPVATATTAASAATSGGATAGLIGADPFDKCETDLTDMVESVIAAGDMYLSATPPEYSQAVSSYQAAGMAGVTVVGPEIDLAGAPLITSPHTYKAWQINAQLAAIPSSTAGLPEAQNAQAIVQHIRAELQAAISAGRAALNWTKPGKTPGGRAQSLAGAAAWTIGLGAFAGVIYAANRPRSRRSPSRSSGHHRR